MGDVILTTPLLTYLKSKNPEAEITLITGSQYAELFKDDPRLVSIVPYFRSDEKKIFSDLALEKWDLIVDLQNNRRTKRLRSEYFQQTQCGLFDKLHLKRFLLLFFRVDFYKKYNNVAHRYILAAGISPETVNDIPLLQ